MRFKANAHRHPADPTCNAFVGNRTLPLGYIFQSSCCTHTIYTYPNPPPPKFNIISRIPKIEAFAPTP